MVEGGGGVLGQGRVYSNYTPFINELNRIVENTFFYIMFLDKFIVTIYTS